MEIIAIILGFVVAILILLVIFLTYFVDIKTGIGPTGPEGICLVATDIAYNLDYQNSTPVQINSNLREYILPIDLEKSQAITELNISFESGFIFLMIEGGNFGNVIKFLKDDRIKSYYFCTKCSGGDHNCTAFTTNLGQCISPNSVPLITGWDGSPLFYSADNKYTNILLGPDGAFVYPEN